MAVRSSNDGRGLGTPPNTTEIVDRLIGTAYDVVKLVSDNIDYVKHVSLNLPHVVLVEPYLNDIRKVAQSITYVVDIGVNLQKLIEIHGALEVLKEIYARLGLLKDIGEALPQIKAVGDNITSVNTAAANITSINTVAANIQVIVEAYEGSKQAAEDAARDAASAKTSEENAKRDAQTASDKAAHVDRVVADFDVNTAQAILDIEATGTEGVRQVRAETQTGLTSLSNSAALLKTSLETTTSEGIASLKLETTASITAIKAAHDAAVTAISNGRSKALTDIEAARTTGINDVSAQGTTAVNAVKSQQTTSVRAVENAGNSAIQSIGVAKEDAVGALANAQTDITSAGNAQVTAINSAGATQKTAVEKAGTDGVAAIQTQQSTAENALNLLMANAEQYVEDAQTSATAADDSAKEAAAVFVKMKGGGAGQFLAKVTGTDYDYQWIDIPGGGDMVSGTYDPDKIARDVYDMANMKDSADFFRLTKAEKERIASYPYGSLKDVPTEFTPKAHEHQIADTIGLQDVLNTFVAGPASVVNGKIVIFSGTTGKSVVASEMDITDVLKRGNHTGTIEQAVVVGLPDALASKAPLDLASGTKEGLMSALSFNRLAAMEDGATKNATDAELRNRATHTGKQDMDTVTGLPEALNAKAGLAVATAAANGLMSKENFSKLAAVEAGAQKNPNMALYQTVAQKGVANGYAGLNAAGKVPESQLPDTVLGSLQYQNAWNAATNTPAIPAAAAANKGHYYMVQVRGSTVIDGENDWEVGDWIVSNGVAWSKIDNTDSVVSVAGLKGAIATAALQTALGLKSAAYTESSAYATAADGALAKTAVQPAGLTKAAVGLGKVEDKTEAERVASGAIADKFASERTTTNTALGLKADKASPAFTGNATFAGTIVANQNISAFSDRRLKSNIQTIQGALQMVLEMRGTTYLKDNTYQYGVIAQEIEMVVPELVYEQPAKGDPFWIAGQRPTLSVDTGNAFTAILIEAIKELKAEVEALKAQIKG